MKTHVLRDEFDEKYRQLHGDCAGMRAQLSEVNKKLARLVPGVYPSEAEVSAREMAALRNDINAYSQTYGELHHTLKPLLYRLSEDVERMKLDESRADSHEAFHRLSQEHAQMKTQVVALQQSNAVWVQTVHVSLQEMQIKLQQAAVVESTLNILQGLFQQLQQTFQQTKSALDQLQGSSRQAATEIQQLQSEFSQVKQEVSKMVEVGRETTRARNEMSNKLSAMEEEVKKAKQVVERLTRKDRDMEQEIERMKQKLDLERRKQLMSLESTKRNVLSKPTELLGLDRTQQRNERETREVQKLKLLSTEFHELRRNLNDLGVLKPSKAEVPLGQPEPVGTIALADDCFSARLLTKLMYIKARAQKQHEMTLTRGLEWLEACDVDLSSSESDSARSYGSEALAFISQGCENVAGLPEPVIEEGAPGYSQVTFLWTAVCVLTLSVQLAIVGVLVKYAQKPTECFDRQPTPQEWLVLHGSKGLAVMVAGALMAKDFMDIVNDTLVSILIEPRLTWDTALMNFCRFSLVSLTGIANILLFEGMVSPLSVWINMAALAFVGELAAAVAEQGRKGVFGHQIRSQLTSLNFELTFISDLPWWIPIVQACTLLYVATFIIVGAYIAARAPDPMCRP